MLKFTLGERSYGVLLQYKVTIDNINILYTVNIFLLENLEALLMFLPQGNDRV